MSSVLYDTPGPKARARNWIYTAVFLVVVGLILWWVLGTMADKGQLDADKWSPFVTDSQVWTTFLLPGLGETLKAGLIAMVIALPLGALLGIGGSPTTGGYGSRWAPGSSSSAPSRC